MTTAGDVRRHLERGETVDLRDPQLFSDAELDSVFSWLRDHAPAYRDSNGLVYVSRYSDICEIERNTQLYTSSNGTVPRIDMSTDESMINLDDPSHASHRRLIVRRFTPRGIRTYAELIRQSVTRCVDSFASTGSCDLVADLAAVVPATVICELLGFPIERWPDCERWARLTLESANRHWDDPEIGDFMGAFTEFVTECSLLLEQRRADPRDDLVSIWAHTEIDGVAMTDKQVLEEALLLLDGGAETTRAVIAFGAVALCENPVEAERLRKDPGLLERSGVEELIRYVTPIHLMRRTATANHRLHDVNVVEGDEILVLYGSGNRDERAFTDPHRLDVGRASNAHLAFGHGTHYCVGANLARFEIRATFEELFRRIPDFRIAADAQVEARSAMFTRVLPSLPLQFTPETR